MLTLEMAQEAALHELMATPAVVAEVLESICDPRIFKQVSLPNLPGRYPVPVEELCAAGLVEDQPPHILLAILMNGPREWAVIARDALRVHVAKAMDSMVAERAAELMAAESATDWSAA